MMEKIKILNEDRNMNKNIIKLNESKLRNIIQESIKKVLKKYKDSKYWGWDYLENNVYNKSSLSPEEINSLHKSYDKYAQEEVLKGNIPNDTGFNIWCMNRELKAQKRGINNLFPNY